METTDRECLVICPNCDAEMYQSVEDEDLWICEECGYEEDRSRTD